MALLLFLFSLRFTAGFTFDPSQDLRTVCPHQYASNVASYVTVSDGQTLYRDIRANQTHLYYYENTDPATIIEAVDVRKLVIKLEPCAGVVFLMVRKSWPCWPNPYSCVNLLTGYRSTADCDWTYLQSNIDGSHDGAPTTFETSLTSTRWFIAVYATQTSTYTLTISSDIGTIPRPGQYGNITASQTGALDVELQWKPATFFPTGQSYVKQYWVYSTVLLDSDTRPNSDVFLRPGKILNTVCGLQNSTDSAYMVVGSQACLSGTCSANITGVITKKRYVFNVVAESEQGFLTAYSGVIMKTDWTTVTTATSSKTITIFSALGGTLIGIFVISYLWLMRIYRSSVSTS